MVKQDSWGNGHTVKVALLVGASLAGLGAAVALAQPPGVSSIQAGASAAAGRAALTGLPHTGPHRHQVPRVSALRTRDAQAGLESALTPPPGTVVDESLPHSHVVDPATGGLISLAGARGVVRDAEDLGPVHTDPVPQGASLANPTTTRALLSRSGVEAFAAPSEGPDAAEVVPPGTPGVSSLSAHVSPSCSGTGTDGKRVQVMYVHEADTADRFSSVLPALRNEVAKVDDVFAVSAQQTGGERRVRWVHDSGCLPVILDVTVPDGSLGSDFWGSVNAVKALGYNRADRKYLMFADANSFCGIGSLYSDARATGNNNDGYAASYSRVDANCWSSSTSVAAHELTHNLGGVQGGAPHATTNGHCFDDHDLMCYDDGSGIPMQNICSASQEQLLDCNHDDYFSTNPASGSYLATSWNTARSSFLDSAVSPGPATPPTVSVTSSSATARTGDPVTFTGSATGATGPLTWAWSAAPTGCRVTPSANTATVLCPSTVTGSLSVTGTATDTGTGASGSGSASIAVSLAPAPGATVTAPASASAGDTVSLVVSPTGTAPFGYAWTSTACTVAAPTAASTSLTCPGDLPTSDVTVSAQVTQADGQSVVASSVVHVTGATAPPPPDPTPAIPTSWGRPGLSGGVLSSVLRDATGTRLAGRAVTLQVRWIGYRATGPWTDLRALGTDANGRVSATISYRRPGIFRFSSSADADYAASTSAAVRILPTSTTSAHPSRHRVSGLLRAVTGDRVDGQTLRLERRRVGADRWSLVSRARTDARGRVSAVVRPAHRTRYRWVFAGEGTHLASHSASVTVR